MEILGSLRKHGLEDADIQHAWLNAIRLVEYDYDGGAVAGHRRRPSRSASGAGRVPAGAATRIIHADLLRPKFYDYLR